jgi:alanyl-tRNA synthetase
LTASASALEGEITQVGGIRFLAAEVPASSMDQLREAGDQVRQLLKSGVAVLGARFDGKAAFLALVTDDLVGGGRLRADQIVREVAKIAGGSGGGKPGLATAGAKEPEKLKAALEAARRILESQLSA